MKPIELDLFTKYSFLSSLQSLKDNQHLTFVETVTDLENNDYKQRLHIVDKKDLSVKPLTDLKKRTPVYPLNDGLYMVENDKEDKTIHTQFKKVNLSDGSLEDGFKLPSTTLPSISTTTISSTVILS